MVKTLKAAYTSVLAAARTEVATTVASGLQSVFDMGKGERNSLHVGAGDLHGMG